MNLIKYGIFIESIKKGLVFLKLSSFVDFIKSKIQDSQIKVNYTGQEAADNIFKLLNSDKPVMICRFGQMELDALKQLKEIDLGIKKFNLSGFNGLKVNAGFFPLNKNLLKKFQKRMLCDIKQIDILGSWLFNEIYFKQELENSIKVELMDLEPYYCSRPWSRVFKGKKILVIHPFEKTIISQYKSQKKLFDNVNVLPKFELKTLKAVQSIGGESDKFKDWFEALKYMEKKIDSIDFDIALIGCGAYGLPLAAYIKRKGKKAVHLGGGLQLLFGIKGKRWENQNFKYFNKYWVSPSEEEKPKCFKKVEDGCYW